MTFLTELERLRAAATKGPWVVNSGNITTTPHYSRWGKGLYEAGIVNKIICVQTPDAELVVLLVNHAHAIAELVRAAKVMVGHEDGDDLQAELDAVNALAKLDVK